MNDLDALVSKAVGEVAECIGCNDCLVACPIPERGLVTIAELNAAVLSPTVRANHVRAFVTACTQCQQCVPVCPADLSRADMLLFNKEKVYAAEPDRAVPARRAGARVATAWTVDTLAARLGELPLLAGVGLHERRRLALGGELRVWKAGDVLVEEGAYREELTLVLSGALRQSARDAAGRVTDLLTLGPGAFVGELAVLADRPEPYALRAVAPTEVLAVPKATVRGLMRTSPPLREALARLGAARALQRAESPLLGALSAEEREVLLGRCALRAFEPGEELVAPDGVLDTLYVVESGFLKVETKRGRAITYLRDGDDFGAMGSLAPGLRARVRITANTRAWVLTVPLAELDAVFRRNPKAREALLARILAEEAAFGGAPGGATVSAQDLGATNRHLTLTSAAEAGLLAGHEVLAIDQRACTDCNNCVDACGRRHGAPRLARDGIVVDHLLFPSACRHCDDPVCLLCTVNGIVRLADGEIRIVPEACIGCGACAERCPFDNIHMVPRDPPAPTLGQRVADLLVPTSARDLAPFDWLWRALGPAPARDDGPKVATKCDLCAGYADQACVRACPTGAAFRFDPVATFGAERMRRVGKDE